MARRAARATALERASRKSARCVTRRALCNLDGDGNLTRVTNHRVPFFYPACQYCLPTRVGKILNMAFLFSEIKSFETFLHTYCDLEG